MDDKVFLNYSQYSPVGDILVIATCLVFIILIKSAYISKTKNFLLFRVMLGFLMFAGFASIFYHVALNYPQSFEVPAICAFRVAYRVALFTILLLYVLYSMIPLRLDKNSDKRYLIISGLGYIILVINEVLGIVFGYVFHVTDNGEVDRNFNTYTIGYTFFLFMLLFILIKYRNSPYIMEL